MRFYPSWLSFLFISVIASAQTAPTHPTTHMPSPSAESAPPQTPAEAMQRAGGSLLRAALNTPSDPSQARLDGISFFAVPDPQPRTLKKHDLVTVIVREDSEYKSEGTTDLKRKADFDAQLQAWIKLQLSNWAIQGGAEGDHPPEIKAQSQRNFKGEATVDRTDTYTVRVTGEVVDVKPNGTLVVQAKQRIKHDEEEMEFVLSGVCRAEDVTPDNTVLSTQMYDKQITTSHKGAVRDTTKRGLISKLLDALNPF
jgi:flagellar L-ring protein precursor FlgH